MLRWDFLQAQRAGAPLPAGASVAAEARAWGRPVPVTVAPGLRCGSGL